MVPAKTDDAWRDRPYWSCWGGMLEVGVSKASEAESLESRMAATVEYGEGTNQVGDVA